MDNQYNGYYSPNTNMPPYGDQGYNYNKQPPDKSKSSGLAIAAFVISLVNLIVFSSFFSFVTVPLCLIFAIISLAGHRGGKVFSIISIVVSVISALIFVFYVVFFVKLMPDIVYFSDNANEIISEFEETGEVPEYFQKYCDPKFDKYWDAMGYEDFEGFFADFIKGFKSGSGNTYNGSDRESSDNEAHGGGKGIEGLSILLIPQ